MANLTEGLSEYGKVEVEEIKVSHLMKANLTSNAFSIVPVSKEEQAVTRDGYNRWVWQVVPNKGGEQRLMLRISTEILLPGREKSITVYDEVFVRPIKVTVKEVPLCDRATCFLKTNWQFIVGTMVLGSGLFGWLNSKIKSKKRQKKDTLKLRESKPEIVEEEIQRISRIEPREKSAEAHVKTPVGTPSRRSRRKREDVPTETKDVTKKAKSRAIQREKRDKKPLGITRNDGQLEKPTKSARASKENRSTTTSAAQREKQDRKRAGITTKKNGLKVTEGIRSEKKGTKPLRIEREEIDQKKRAPRRKKDGR